MMDVASILSRAKDAFEVEQDQELAAYLGINRATLASWKRRQSIPAKYLSEMLDGGRISLDWLVTGKGRKEQINEFGLSDDEDIIDQKVLWIALRSVAGELLASDNSVEEQMAMWLLDSKHLATIHIHLNDYIKRVTHSKQKWEASGLVAGDDVYRALATEFRTGGTYEEPTPPWWEDDSVV